MLTRSFRLAGWWLPLAGSMLHAQFDFQPNVRPTLAVRRAAGPVTIDGELGDPGWAGASKAGNFSEVSPRENARPEGSIPGALAPST